MTNLVNRRHLAALLDELGLPSAEPPAGWQYWVPVDPNPSETLVLHVPAHDVDQIGAAALAHRHHIACQTQLDDGRLALAIVPVVAA